MAAQTSPVRQRQPRVPACPALLLLGPSGAGKTPLGSLIDQRGLWGRRMVHFDFGAVLRATVQAHRYAPQAATSTAAPEQPASTGVPRLSPAEIAFLEDVLRRGLLLEDEHFPLAERLLRAFLQRQHVDEQTWVVLNGLPRHVGQARALAPLLAVRVVVLLDCPAETVLERIRRNIAGDRTQRDDDQPGLVAQKLAIYQQRTAPLLAFYREQGSCVVRLTVGPTTTPEEMWGQLAKRNPLDRPEKARRRTRKP